MDASCRSVSSNKKLRSRNQGIDRVSSLPDYILHQVLSFLVTKDVIRTSVLSTRWRYLWTSIANIDLEYHPSFSIDDRDRLANVMTSCLEFVDRVLILHDVSDIRRLHLMIPVPVDCFRLNSWTCAVIKHNVEDLALDFDVNGHSTLPSCLFTCPTLVVLKLSVNCALKAPVATHLSKLKTLHLSYVIFTDDVSAQRLFSNCPVLDELSLVRCGWKNIKNITISIPTLKNLTIVGGIDFKYISKTLIKIVAADLTHLDCWNHLDIHFQLSDLRSLEAASVNLINYDDYLVKEVGPRTISLFSEIYNVKILNISTETLECVMHVEAFLDHLPTFYNLTRLTVNSEFHTPCREFLMEFLEKMPKLEYLDLSEGCKQDERMSPQDDPMPQRVPSCFNSSLRTFAIRNYEAEPQEMVLLQYVWRHATCLESLVVSCSKHLRAVELFETWNHLKSLLGGSESCNVGFNF